MQKYKRKQSAQDRQKRLEKGCCPIHGIFMPQTGNELAYCPCCKQESRTGRFIVSCPRNDCDISAFCAPHGTDYVLFQESTNVLLGE